MAQGLLGGVLPAIYSGADQLKRGVYGLLNDPMEQARRAGQGLLQSRADRQALMARTFANPDRPFQVTDQAGLAQLGDQVMAGELGFAPAGITAFHGTPHNILGKFDINKVGTGEGAQAYGHGMYFAENPAVAKEYQKALSGRTDLGQQPSDPAFIHAVESFREAGTPLSVIPAEMKKAYKSATDKDIQLAIQATEKGNLYKVDIPDEYIPNMLDWDKPLSQQPIVMNALRSEAEQRVKSRVLDNLENDIRSSLPPIDIGNDFMAMFSDANVKAGQEIKKQALEKLKKMDLSDQFDKELESMKPRDMNWNMTGKEFYELMSKNQGSAAKASEFFQRQGVTGIRYLDAGSRPNNIVDKRLEDLYQKYSGDIEKAADDFMRTVHNTPKEKAKIRETIVKLLEDRPTSNFVVFEPSQVKILEQNSKPYDPLEAFIKGSSN